MQAGLAIGIYLLIMPSIEKSTRVEKAAPVTADADRKEVATAIFMESQLVPLPITILPGEVAHIVSLNKRRITSPNSVNWGFYTVSNEEVTIRKWPDQKVMDQAMEAQQSWHLHGRLKSVITDRLL